MLPTIQSLWQISIQKDQERQRVCLNSPSVASQLSLDHSIPLGVGSENFGKPVIYIFSDVAWMLPIIL